MEEDMEVKEILREEFFRDWLENSSQQQIIEKLIQNDERAKQIKELEKQIQRKENIIKHLENSNAKYYEDNVCLLRKNGHIDILSDNLHYKYWDDAKNYIPKSKIKEKIKEYEDSYMISDITDNDMKENYKLVIIVLQELLEE